MSSELPDNLPAEVQNDPLAGQIAWEPLHPTDGSSLATASLECRGDRATFVPTFLSKLIIWIVFGFSGLCLIIGTVVTVLGTSGRGEEESNFVLLIGIGFIVGGMFFIGVAFFLRNKLLRLAIFDRKLGLFWKGKHDPPDVSPNRDKGLIALDDAHALQLLAKWIKQSGPDADEFFSYELNLVLSDAVRVNTVDHGDLQRLQNDAGSLAAFLDVPIWDATG